MGMAQRASDETVANDVLLRRTCPEAVVTRRTRAQRHVEGDPVEAGQGLVDVPSFAWIVLKWTRMRSCKVP